MEQEKRRRTLIRLLLEEEGPAKDRRILVPRSERNQKDLLRALFNLRPAKPADGELLALQDAYLRGEAERRGIVDANALPAVPDDPRIVLWNGDITKLKIDAVVNSASPHLLGCFRPLHHKCVNNLIHTRAGVQLRYTCKQLMDAQGHDEPAGRAKLTPGYNLPAKYVLHTVPPRFTDAPTKQHEAALASCYRSCIRLAAENGLRSIAFCCLASGKTGFPKERAAEIAVEAVREALNETPEIERVVFSVIKKGSLVHYRRLLKVDEG